MSEERVPQAAGDEFQDPLENYEAREYDDLLEQALAEKPASAIQHTPYTWITPNTLICEAVRTLSEMQHACVLVAESGKLVGVFSDRDILDRVALEYDTVKNQPVSDVMTANPVYIYETDSAAAALSVMAVSGYRHVPVLNLQDDLVGIISPQRVTSFLQQHFGSE